jgi:hypothetical protein
MPARETKVFDPADGFAPFDDPWVVTDSTLAHRDGRWWMYVAGKLRTHESIALFSASLPQGAPLSATGWSLTPHADDPRRVALLAGHERSGAWDLEGGRHCPSYVGGLDARDGRRVERIYYAGGAGSPWGPYAIGYLEWDGARWVEQPEPAFVAEEAWERGSVYEPNLVYADGLWKMWYVAGSNAEDHLVHGFAESEDGRTGWRHRRVVFPPEEKVFDFAVTRVPGGYEAVFSRVWLGRFPPPPATGLWWCRADEPSPDPGRWSTPVQIMTAADRGWHAGPWKPSLRYDESDPDRMFVFFDGQYVVPGRAGFPFVFTLGCLEMDRPR